MRNKLQACRADDEVDWSGHSPSGRGRGRGGTASVTAAHDPSKPGMHSKQPQADGAYKPSRAIYLSAWLPEISSFALLPGSGNLVHGKFNPTACAAQRNVQSAGVIYRTPRTTMPATSKRPEPAPLAGQHSKVANAVRASCAASRTASRSFSAASPPWPAHAPRRPSGLSPGGRAPGEPGPDVCALAQAAELARNWTSTEDPFQSTQGCGIVLP